MHRFALFTVAVLVLLLMVIGWLDSESEPQAPAAGQESVRTDAPPIRVVIPEEEGRGNLDLPTHAAQIRPEDREQSTIGGTIVNGQGLPVAHSEVWFWNRALEEVHVGSSDAPPSKRVVCDSQGRFVIREVHSFCQAGTLFCTTFSRRIRGKAFQTDGIAFGFDSNTILKRPSVCGRWHRNTECPLEIDS